MSAAKPQPLPHGMGRHPEPGCDLLDADAALMQPVERLELIGQVHVLADHVLGKARFGSVYAVRVRHAAGNGGALGDALLLGQQLEGGQPAPAGNDA